MEVNTTTTTDPVNYYNNLNNFILICQARPKSLIGRFFNHYSPDHIKIPL